ncbi:hypothetical protein BS47DRAFT_1430796 [Hydnum rufescens UP504]|uniref:DUF6589 domain-containing protein n=1 Tax=Hydnum rufescens UP504 TaxID=1448309 RepID=A0A9P6B593_9AGAM|nr:hypothetical protein BS47DRAFT_1430796 [Hydnum rufescens UP504]
MSQLPKTPITQGDQASASTPRNYTPRKTDSEKIDAIFDAIKANKLTFPLFLYKAFDPDTPKSTKHAATISSFLRGQSNIGADNIAHLMFNHSSSVPIQGRASTIHETPLVTTDGSGMAHVRLLAWAIDIVTQHCMDEVKALTHPKSGGLHLSQSQLMWKDLQEWSVAAATKSVETKASTLLQILIAVATQGDSAKISKACGANWDPKMISVITILVLAFTCNTASNIFQKIIGIWLFANSAAYRVYQVLSHIGLSVSYNTVLRSLHIGQANSLMSGTASMMVKLEGFTPRAFDPLPLVQARNERRRAGLSCPMLKDCIDEKHLCQVMALHCISFLIEDSPSLLRHRKWVTSQFENNLSKHHMRKGRKTTIHPLATSDINEATISGNKDVIDNILLKQLSLSEEDIKKVLIIIGGNQSTIEKMCTLKSYLADCPHGYPTYNWVIPLIQLWHMQWANLAHVIGTHWGPSTNTRETSTYSGVNNLLRRGVKNIT